MPKRITPEQIAISEAAREKEYYHRKNMWEEDLSDAIASGDLSKLEEAFAQGWDVNQPLLRFYLEIFRGACNWLEEMLSVVFPVMWAIRNNCFTSAEWLIAHGAKLNMKKSIGKIWGCDLPRRRCCSAEGCFVGYAALCRFKRGKGAQKRAFVADFL